MAKKKKVMKKKKKTAAKSRTRPAAKKKTAKKKAPAKRSTTKSNAAPREIVEKQLRRADSFYKQFHWDRDAKEIIKVTGVRGVPPVLVSLGELHAVEYKAQKGNDKRKETYRHVFKAARPLLCCDPQGRNLYIIEGDYTITERGIEG